MHFIAAAAALGLDKAHHFYAGLQGMVGRYQAYIPAADDEKPFGRAHQVPVHQGLESAGPVNPGQCIAGEGQAFFPRAGGANDGLGAHQVIFIAAQDAGLLVGENGQAGSVRPDLHRRVVLKLAFQLGGDVHAARAGIAVLHRAEKFMGLQHQLAAQGGLIVDHQGVHVQLAELRGRGQAGGPAAYDQSVHFQLLHAAEFRRAGDARQPGLAAQGFNFHSRAHGGNAGLHRQPVGDHGTLGALPVGAEDALRR